MHKLHNSCQSPLSARLLVQNKITAINSNDGNINFFGVWSIIIWCINRYVLIDFEMEFILG